MKPRSAASAITFFKVVRGQPAKGLPSGLAMSQISRPTRAPLASAQGKHLEGREVGTQIHVRLLDAHETFDRRAVEHDLAVERLAELPVGDFDILDDAEDVRELQAEKLDALLFGTLEDRLLFTGLDHCVMLAGQQANRPTGEQIKITRL